MAASRSALQAQSSGRRMIYRSANAASIPASAGRRVRIERKDEIMDRRVMLTGLCLGAALASARPVRAQMRTPHQVAEQFAATLTAHDMEAFAALFADDYINH